MEFIMFARIDAEKIYETRLRFVYATRSKWREAEKGKRKEKIAERSAGNI